jgi:hypothetical protein
MFEINSCFDYNQNDDMGAQRMSMTFPSAGFPARRYLSAEFLNPSQSAARFSFIKDGSAFKLRQARSFHYF